MEKFITLEGKVTKLDWINPHCLLHFEAKNEKNELVEWTIEIYNPLWLRRAGWTRTTLQPGDADLLTVSFAMVTARSCSKARNSVFTRWEMSVRPAPADLSQPSWDATRKLLAYLPR
jgi:hypothetical protein